MDNLYTDSQWYAMVDAGLSAPQPLATAGFLNDMWVYYRPWGIMYVPTGYHQRAMATLFTIHHGHLDTIDYAASLGIKGYRANEELADRFLMELTGTAFKSSVGQSATTGSLSSLNAIERRIFADAKLSIASIE